MLLRRIPFLFFCFFNFWSFQSAAQEKIYFEPKAALGGRQSDFINCKGIVIFETTPESKFDKYSRIIPTKNYLIVCDYSAKKILVFDKNGRFINKLKNKLDLGRLNYNEEKDRLEVVAQNKMYQLTSKDRSQILENFSNPKNKKYYRKYFIDFSDTLHLTVKKQKISSSDILNPVSYTDGMYIVNQVTVDKNFAKEEDYELKIYRGDSLLQQYFPYKKKTDSRYIYDGGTVAVTPAAISGTKWVTHPYDYTIYALQKDSLYKVYSLILPIDRAIPADFFTKDFQNKTEKDNYSRQNKKAVKQVYVYNLNSRYISIGLQGMYYDNQQYIYDTHTKGFYSVEKLVPDSLSFYLPVCNNFSFNEGPLIYSRLIAADILKAAEAHKKETIVYPPLLQAYLNTATPESNPVLISFTYSN
jgi:hypothetical protein